MATAHDTYFEESILGAEPMELVRALYGAALDSVEKARRHVREGDIRARSREITKAYEIVTELAESLNHQQGGELSRNLASLYDYMERRLLQANREQSEAPLAEVSRLLGELQEAWRDVH